MKVRDQIRLKELEIGVPVVFKKLLEQNGGDICCGRVSENGKIACSCGYKGIFEEEDAEILDYYADADYLNVRAYPLGKMVSDILPNLQNDNILTFASSGGTGVNFGIAFQHIFETKVLVSGYWGGYSMEDNTGDVRLFNCSQKDISESVQWQKEIINQLSGMIRNIDADHQGFVFVKLGSGKEEATFTEVCPECGIENTFEWDVQKEGLEAYCPHCGVHMMLCSECRENCNWNSATKHCSGATAKGR